jgi:hypothetical protein
MSHRQEEMSTCAVRPCFEFGGQVKHAVEPGTDLYFATAQAVHVPPSLPVKPLLQIHAVEDFEIRAAVARTREHHFEVGGVTGVLTNALHLSQYRFRA